MVLEYAAAFLIGSIPTAYWYAKYFHNIDIRKHGSGNVGATNSLRVIGKKAGIVVLLVDMLKGLLPVLAAKYLNFPAENVLLMGIFAVLGHLFSPFVGFKGGKGIATSLGVILAFSPLAALASIVLFAITLYIFRYVSLSSIIGVITFLIFLMVEGKSSQTVQLLALGLAVLLIISHRQNIKRLFKGTESKI